MYVGLDELHVLTTSESYKLRIELEDVRGNKEIADYKYIVVLQLTALLKAFSNAFNDL